MPKILVVDDQPLNVEFLKDELGKLEYEIVTAADGQQALQQIWDTAPDLVLLDLAMPGMGGLEVLGTLRKDPRYENLPVLLLTASPSFSDRIKGFEAGADDYITKPFSIEEVVARIHAHLRIQTLQREAMEREAMEREKLLARVEGIGQTLVTLAHHINNATQSISGMAQLCQLEPDNADQHRELIKISLSQTEKISAVLESLRQMVDHLDIRTTDYAGDPNRMLDIEESLRQRLEDNVG